MNVSEVFIRRPIATSLLMAALALVGIVAFPLLPVAPLPQVDFPTINVTATFAGASPEIMAATVATPLERQFGQIAGVSQMSSVSSLGSTVITLQFDLDRNIDGAAQDVQAAITSAAPQLPKNLTSPPTYKKVNPADSPILIVSATSSTIPLPKVDDFAENIVAQQISQVSGVAQVQIGGQQRPAIRVQVDPGKLTSRGLTLEDVRGALANVTTDAPKGTLIGPRQSFTITANDQLTEADRYNDVIIAYRNGAPVRVRDIGQAVDGPQDVTLGALHHEQAAVMLLVFKQPGANVIETVDNIKMSLGSLGSLIPPGIHLDTIVDRTQTIRASVKDVEFTLLLSCALVVLVIMLFLRSIHATLIPGAAVPLSLLGATAIIYLAGFSLDNLSLMALTIAVGFVVDDAIVVVENIFRHLEAGTTPLQSAIKGAREIGFTVISISVSLIAVFIPLLLMSGIVGRLFHEFAITVTAAIVVSVIVSLTLTPMLCSRFLVSEHDRTHGRLYRAIEWGFDKVLDGYRRGLDFVLRHQFPTLLVFLATVAMTAVLFVLMPKGFFPTQDIGMILGISEAGQDVSPDEMRHIQRELSEVIARDPDVADFGSFFGPSYGNTQNTGRFVIGLKPRDQRTASASQIVDRLRPQLAKVPGVRLFLQPAQDITVGGRIARGQFQYVLQDPDLHELNTWAPRLIAKMKKLPELADVASDAQNLAPLLTVTINRDAAARFGIEPQLIDSTLNDAFGQEEVTQYFTNNAYYLVLEVLPSLQGTAQTLNQLYIKAPTNGAARAALHAGQCRHRPYWSAAGFAFRTVSGGDADLQSAAGGGARPGGRRHSAGVGRDRHAIVADHQLPRQCAGVPGRACQRADPDRRGIGGRLRHSRRALRKLHPSADHSLDAAFGRRRRAAGAVGRRLRPVGHRHHRPHPADRHRQEKRHHAGRLRHQSRTRRALAARSGAAGLSTAVSSDHDDDHDGIAQRRAADAGPWFGIGTASAARLRHGRRARVQSDADAVHDPGGLSLSRPIPDLAERRPAPARGSARGVAHRR